ncbi:hypothetical protein BJV74DRAFT_886368 [Russula compacta]|nr:hypothetical protein BJV74DRAFT_886368 [Russula compacta]
MLISSAIIEDIKSMREATPSLIAYHYFDFKDASKRGVRGLLTLYTSCRNGSEQPSDAALSNCLKTMFELPGQIPIFVIVDALDECPSNIGTPSAREKVLDFVKNIIGVLPVGHPSSMYSIPASIRRALRELPTTLDDTHERVLQEILKEKWQHAHRLFQCLVAAIRPLRVEELGEIFAIEFDGDIAPDLMEGWRPENAEEAVLSACSTLIAVIEDYGSRIVQFSHVSVKEFPVSDRLKTSEVGNIRRYHILLDTAHTILARACVAMLLQLDEKIDKKRLASFL